MLKKTTICCFLFILPSLVVSQKVLKENLTERVRLYWDSEKKHIRSRGAYYTDPIIGDTKEKHGKWWFYDAKGHITEEQNFFRDRIHGQQISFHANKAKATESYFVYNVADSIYREWTEEDTLITEGSYEMGSPKGLWRYFYNNGKLKSKKSISNDTIYLIDHFLNDSSHTQLISNGNGTKATFFKMKATIETGQMEDKHVSLIMRDALQEGVRNAAVDMREYAQKKMEQRAKQFSGR